MIFFIRILLPVLLQLWLGTTASAQTYKIGILAPLSGPSADKGIAIRNSAQLFIDDYHRNHPDNGIHLELMIRDDHDDAEQAVVAAREMAADPGIMAVMGHYHATPALATAKVFNEAGVPFLSPWVSSTEMLAINRAAFTVNVTDADQASYMATYVSKVLGKDNVLLIYNTGSMGQALKEAFMHKAERLGLTVARTLEVEPEPSDPDWVKTHLPDTRENARFGAIIALTHSETGAVILPQLRQQGLQQPVMAIFNWMSDKFIEMDEQYTGNVHVVSPFMWEIANQNATRFFRNYRSHYQKKPSFAAVMTWDSLRLIANSIEALARPDRPESVTRPAIRDFLTGMDLQHAVEGLTGLLYFRQDDAMTARYVNRYQASHPDPGNRPAPVDNVSAPLAVAGGVDASNRMIRRDLYVAQIVNGLFRMMPIQLVQPREEYLLEQLAEQIDKGTMRLIDHVPYQVIDVVFIGCDILRITDVNIRDMTWTVELFMWFKWSAGLDMKDIDRIVPINAVNDKSDRSELFMENLNNTIKYRAYKKRITLNTAYDLELFPFDSQILRMSLAHVNKNSRQLLLVPDTRHMETSPVTDIKPQEWSYRGREYYSDLYRFDSTFGNPDYRHSKGYKSPVYFSTINLDIDLNRIINPYIYTFFMPLMIILGINLMMVFWVPLDQFAPRINATLSALIGILLYHMSQKNSFPKVGYSMIADKYFLLAYVFVVMMIFSNMTTQRMMSQGLKEQAKQWNHRMSIAAFILCFSLYGLLTVWSIYRQD